MVSHLGDAQAMGNRYESSYILRRYGRRDDRRRCSKGEEGGGE